MSAFLDWFEENSAWIERQYLHLHNIPEPSDNEKETAEYISKVLSENGWEVKRGFAGEAVLGIRKGAENGPVICLRADMDALCFAVDGCDTCIHACGHDANMAEVLAVAVAAVKTGFPQKGTFKVLFQPCEEQLRGAMSVVKSGVLDDVEYMYTTHLRASDELQYGATPAVLHGALDWVILTIYGKAAHSAHPQMGLNAVTISCEIVHRLARQKLSNEISYSLKATRFEADSGALNIIPAQAKVWFDLRAQTNEKMEEIKSLLESTAEDVCNSFSAKFNVEYMGGVAAAERSDELIMYATSAIQAVYGKEWCIKPIITAGSEDFHNYARMLPNIKTTVVGFGAFMNGGLHNPAMSFDHRVLPKAAKTLALVAEQITGNWK